MLMDTFSLHIFFKVHKFYFFPWQIEKPQGMGVCGKSLLCIKQDRASLSWVFKYFISNRGFLHWLLLPCPPKTLD